MLKALALPALWIAGSARAKEPDTAPEPHWMPDSYTRQRFAKIDPTKIKRLEFGGMDITIVSSDPVVVTDKALIRKLYRALLASEYIEGHIAIPETATRDYMRIIVASDKNDKSNNLGEEIADVFDFNPLNVEWCHGRTFHNAMKDLEPVMAQRIRDQVTAIAPRITSVEIGIDKSETIWEPAERKRLVDALKATDRSLCRFTDPGVEYNFIFCHVPGQDEPLTVVVFMGREKATEGSAAPPLSPTYATLLEFYKRNAERYGDPNINSPNGSQEQQMNTFLKSVYV